MSSMFPCISDSPSRTNVLTIIFLLVAPRCRDVCNVCQHEWWAVGSTRVASTRGMPLSMHISPSLLPSFARPCQDHEELIGTFLLSCAPGQARARRRPASAAAAAAAATTTVAAAAVTTTTMAAEVSKCGCECVRVCTRVRGRRRQRLRRRLQACRRRGVHRCDSSSSSTTSSGARTRRVRDMR